MENCVEVTDVDGEVLFEVESGERILLYNPATKKMYRLTCFVQENGRFLVGKYLYENGIEFAQKCVEKGLLVGPEFEESEEL